MKNITNKKLNQLTIIAASLQKLQRKNVDGSLMFRSATKVVKGKDLKKSQVKALTETKEYYPDKNYLLRYDEPVLVDHKQNLIEAYQKHSDVGVHEYINSVNKFAEENKKPITKALSFFQKLKSRFFRATS